MQPAAAVVFDTDCVLCSGMVHFVLRHERGPTIRFVSAWSPSGLALAAAHGLTEKDLNDTYLVVENGIGYTRSDAGIVLLGHLRAPWRWGAPLLRMVPRFVRDPLYTFVAHHRYRWFGHAPRCFRPPPASADRFIDS